MSERVALVTGGTKGIGRAISRMLAAEGTMVYMNYSSDEKEAAAAREELQGAGYQAGICRADVSDAGQVTAMMEYISSEKGRLDILVNNAGIIKDGLLMLMPEANWRRVIDINLTGVYFCAKAALRLMVGNRWGRVINIISPSALMGRAGQTNYAASKGGILSFTRSLAREVARYGITVNAVSPGVIETELTRDMQEKVKKEFLSMIPVGRFGTTDEVANAVSFLASDVSGYITGEYISVDGGLT